MKLTDILQLIFKGKPIIQTYQIDKNENEFKDDLRKIVGKSSNPFSKTEKRFVGYFYDEYGRSFNIKIRPRFLNNKSYNNSIKIFGNIKAIDTKKVLLKLTFQRTRFSKYSHWIVLVILGFTSVIFVNKLSRPSDLIVFLGVIFFFYFVFVIMSITDIIQGVKYTIKHLKIKSR